MPCYQSLNSRFKFSVNKKTPALLRPGERTALFSPCESLAVGAAPTEEPFCSAQSRALPSRAGFLTHGWRQAGTCAGIDAGLPSQPPVHSGATVAGSHRLHPINRRGASGGPKDFQGGDKPGRPRSDRLGLPVTLVWVVDSCQDTAGYFGYRRCPNHVAEHVQTVSLFLCI